MLIPKNQEVLTKCLFIKIGLKTTQDLKFYALSAPFDQDFDNSEKDLVIQYSVKWEQGIGTIL
jgi:hypothetical protein